ncbi:MAG: phosphotransferase, partial [Alphaproteobacteria bacterium]|nr:phosphotransferase [Alphaproteobacteria bacterium]
DASFRRYYRLLGAPKPMLLMEDPPDRPPVPPFVMVEPYIKIADHLRSMGLHTPEILFKDIPNGLLVIEDFGDDTYTRLFEKGADPKPLYELAVDALVRLHQHPKRNDIDLPKHDADVLIDGAMLLLDWYYPALTGKKPTEDMKKSFANVWKGLFEKLPKDQLTLVLRDYHVDNLMLVPGATGLQSCGLLDFQDASIGQFAYDLMSLLEDARRDMPADLKQHLYDRYINAMKIDRAAFDYAFRVLAAQRHARVLGVFVRLSLRDGKTRYLQFIPHVHKLFIAAINTPVMKPLKQWFDNNGIDIQQPLKS